MMRSTIPVRSLPAEIKQAVESNGGQIISRTHGWLVSLEHTNIIFAGNEVDFALADGTHLIMQQLPETTGHRNELHIGPKHTMEQTERSSLDG